MGLFSLSPVLQSPHPVSSPSRSIPACSGASSLNVQENHHSGHVRWWGCWPPVSWPFLRFINSLPFLFLLLKRQIYYLSTRGTETKMTITASCGWPQPYGGFYSSPSHLTLRGQGWDSHFSLELSPSAQEPLRLSLFSLPGPFLHRLCGEPNSGDGEGLSCPLGRMLAALFRWRKSLPLCPWL